MHPSRKKLQRSQHRNIVFMVRSHLTLYSRLSFRWVIDLRSYHDIYTRCRHVVVTLVTSGILWKLIAIVSMYIGRKKIKNCASRRILVRKFDHYEPSTRTNENKLSHCSAIRVRIRRTPSFRPAPSASAIISALYTGCQYIYGTTLENHKNR